LASSKTRPEPCPHIELKGKVLQDNPKTLNAGISHAKRELPMVVTRYSKDVRNFTDGIVLHNRLELR
jgi:hypothetical protein